MTAQKDTHIGVDVDKSNATGYSGFYKDIKPHPDNFITRSGYHSNSISSPQGSDAQNKKS